MGAWIEILMRKHQLLLKRSPPTWGRGLKSVIQGNEIVIKEGRPLHGGVD